MVQHMMTTDLVIAGTNSEGGEETNEDCDFSDDEIQDFFQHVQDDLLKDQEFNKKFFLSFVPTNSPQKPSHTFSDDRSFNPHIVCTTTVNSRNIIHHLIDSCRKNKPETAAATRIAVFVRILLKSWPDMLLDRLEDGQSPLEEAVVEDGCMEIIQAICEQGIERTVSRFPEANPWAVTSAEQSVVSSRTVGPVQQLAHVQTNAAAQNGVSGHHGTEATISNQSGMVTQITWGHLLCRDRDTYLHKALKKKSNNYVHYLLDVMETANAIDAILSHSGQDGLTPLHLAVDFRQCYGNQVEIVAKLIDLYPEALKSKSGHLLRHHNGGIVPEAGGYARNSITHEDRGYIPELKENLSPYRYFIDTQNRVKDSALAQKAQPTSGRPTRIRPGAKWDEEVGRKVGELLRLSCMRYFGDDRATIREILPITPGQIHFDLNPRTEVSKELLDCISESNVIRFEPYLQYVYIPNLQVVDVKMEKLEAEPWWKSRSRKDYVYIFEWLKTTMKVKRILKIVVEDDPQNLHSDEAIERAVAGFHIEQWNWVKPDICSDTILAAAPDVRDLSLYWGGNRAILKSWAAMDGLALLKELRTVRIMTPEFIESHERTNSILSQFRNDLWRSWDNCWSGVSHNRNPPSIEFEPVFRKSYVARKISEAEWAERGRKEKWLKSMESFSQTLRRWFNNRPADDKNISEDQTIKVAIIDDGLDIDKDGIGRNVALGETFYDNKGHWPGFYQSAYGHGTLMASQIRQICPRVQLYIAKLNEVWSDGKSQITARSAAEAIEWARTKQVDIISMSWSIENLEEPDRRLLEDAVRNALADEILLFCASNDQGNLTDIPYPARVDPERIFKIGSATALGLREDMAQGYVDFIAPGAEFLKRATSQNDQGFAGPRSGSSIATARCAGLAAVILQCVTLYCCPKKRVRTYRNMRSMLKGLVDETDKHNYLRVWKVFDVALDKAELGEDFEWRVISDVASVFMGKADYLSQASINPQRLQP